MTNVQALDSLGDSIFYVSSLLGDQPRAIDRYIDYFGEPAGPRSRTGPRIPSERSRGRRGR
jgi:hypothetical protein